MTLGDLLSILSDNQPTTGTPYPKGRYATMLVIMSLLLLVLIFTNMKGAVKQKAYTEDAYQTGMTASIDAKFYYVMSRWNRLLPETSGNKAIDADRFHMQAVRTMESVVSSAPTAQNLRKMIVIAYPSSRPGYVKRLLKTKEFVKNAKKLAPEASMWKAVYASSRRLTPKEVKEYSPVINTLDLGWYRHLIKADLFTRAGDPERAEMELDTATGAVSWSVVFFMIFGLAFVLSIPLGLFIGLLFLLRKHNGLPSAPPEPVGMHPIARSYVSGYLIEVFVAFLLLHLIIQQLFPVLGIPILKRLGLPPTEMSLVLTTIAYVVWGGVSFFYLNSRLKENSWNWRLIGFTTHSVGRDILWGVCGYIAVIPFMLGAGLISRILTRNMETPSNPIIPMLIKSDDLWARILILVLASVVAPLVEETFFRGVLFTGLRARWSLAASIVVSGFVFALLHPLPSSLLPIMVLGAAFAILRNQRGSLLPGMVAHCLNNTMVFILYIVASAN